MDDPTEADLRADRRRAARLGPRPVRRRGAVELFLAHRDWLRRSDFQRAALLIGDDGPAYIGVDWAAAARFASRAPASGSEIAMLRLAVGLAGQVVHEPPGDLLSGLDQANITIVLDAVALVDCGFASVGPVW